MSYVMFCPKCGDPVEPNEVYCNKCGSFINANNNSLNMNGNASFQPSYVYNKSKFNILNNKKMMFIGTGVGLVIIVILIISIFVVKKGSDSYYFSDNSYEDSNVVIQADTNQIKGKYSTVILTDNKYSGVTITSDEDAYKLISQDSVSQKIQCPSEILAVEDEIINDYGITAVNLCEMDVEFAKEISNVIKKIYDEYPTVRGYLTNLSLVNASISDGYIAAFMPVFTFATSNTSSTYPWVIKTRILLNSSYFLNTSRLDLAIKDSSDSGHFPPNATIYSPVAHEMGHYLSFLAMMKNYDMNSILLVDNKNIDQFYDVYYDFAAGKFSYSMINEAYNNYKNDTNSDISLDDWRATISQYAMAKDNSGNYIYDETIAEAFHDVYLNGENAKDASKYIVAVLKEKLG